MIVNYFVYGISCLLVLLGFIALLLQKVYLDPKTDQPHVKVDVPFFGKMQTNIPALAFLFFGVALAAYAYSSQTKFVDWQLNGHIKYDGSEPIDFREGKLQVFPCGIKSFVSKEGRFQIEMKVEEGRSIEEEIQRIDYTHIKGSNLILLKQEYQIWKENPYNSLIKQITENSRMYKDLMINDSGNIRENSNE